MNWILNLALIATLAVGHPPRMREPRPWHLMVGIQETGKPVNWLTYSYQDRDECRESIAIISLSVPVNGKVVDAYCIRDPYEA